MNTKHTARLAVTAGLCLSMTLSGMPVEAIAEELVGTTDSPTAEVTSEPEGASMGSSPVADEQGGSEQGYAEQGDAEQGDVVDESSQPEAVIEENSPVHAEPAAELEQAEPADGELTEEPSGIDGYVEDEQGNVEISSVAGLKHFAKVVNNGNKMQGKTVKLTANLDLNNEPWEPIGNTDTKSFNGVFDGGNHVISNLLVEGSVNTSAANAYHGLFGCTANGEVKNLTINNARVTGGLEVGAIVGRPYTSKMTNLTLTGDVQVSGLSYVGGMLGKNAYANLTNLTVNVSPGSRVEAQSEDLMTYVGGVVGFMGEGNITVSNVISNIDVCGSTAGIGGIAGNIHYGNTFSNCSVAEGTEVKMTAANPKYHPFDTMQIGGIAGLWVNAGNTDCAISDCVFAGSLCAVSRENEDYTSLISGNTIVGGPKSENGTGSLSIVNDGATTVLPGGSSEMQGVFDSIADGATIKLVCDVEANATVPQGVTATIDLAGHMLTASTGTAILVNGGNLTLMDSTATVAPVVSEDRESVTYASGKVVATSGVGITVTGDGSLTMESGTVESIAKDGVFVGAQGGGKGTFVMNGGYIQAREFGIGVIMEGSNATINGGVVMTKDNAALAGNGSTGQGGTDITVAGGTLISHIESPGYIACGVYHPQTGKLTITGGEIYADGGAGVLMRAGSADITGGTIIATGTASGGVGDKNIAVPSSGIVVERTRPDYPGAKPEDVVNISGDAVVKSDESLEAVDVIVPEGEPEKGLAVISGGTFDGKKPSDDLLNNEVTFEEHTDGTFGVAEKKIAQIGDATYPSLAKALAAAQDGDTIELLGDAVITEGTHVEIDKSVIVDLNGRALVNEASATRPLYVKQGATLTIDGTTEGSEVKIANPASYGLVEAELGASLEINGGTYSGDTENGAFFRMSAGDGSSTGNSTITMKDLSVKTNSAVLSTKNTVPAGSSINVEVIGGNYVGDGVNKLFWVDTVDRCPVKFEGVHAVCNGGLPVIEVAGAELTLNDCDFSVKGANTDNFSDTAVFVGYNGKAVFNGGSYTSKGHAVYIGTSGGEVVINDGLFHGDKGSVEADTDDYYDVPSHVVIKGGSFEGGLGVKENGSVPATIEVSGGTFDEPVEEEFCAPGYVPVNTPDANGNYTVEVPEADRVASIDGRYYPTLQEAIDAVKDGQTVTLLKDAAENIVVPEGADCSLDLNGHTLSGGSVKNKAAITNEGTLTILDSSAAATGCIKREDTGVPAYYVVDNQGTMTIESGSFYNNSGDGAGSGSSLVRNAGAGKPAELNIKGGHFQQDAFIVIKNDDFGTLTMTGGTIVTGKTVGNNTPSAIQNWSQAEITGGLITGAIWTSVWDDSLPASQTVIGGAVEVDGEIISQRYANTLTAVPKVEITGGGVIHNKDNEWTVQNGGVVEVSGGRFDAEVPLEHCAPGYGPVDLGNGNYGVSTEQTYVVKHLFEAVDSDDYIEDSNLTETLAGTIGEQTAANAREVKGFKAEAIEQQAIAADGSTIVEVKYSRTRHTVTFDAKGGTSAPAQENVKFGAKVERPADPIKEGCEFLGWYKAGTFEKFDFDAETVTGDLQLVAHWALKNHTIEFDANGGEPLGSVTLEYGATLEAPQISRVGYTLTGWTDAAGTAVEFPITVKSDLRLTAQWQLNKPTATITASNSSDDIHAGDVVTLTAHAEHELDGVTYEYQWYNGRTKIEGATAKTLEVTEDGSYTVDVVAVDGENKSDPATSNSITLTFDLWDVVLSFDSTMVEKHMGDAPFTNNLKIATFALGSTTYASSDESVATVDSRTGEVTIKGPGKATIAAEVEQTDTHKGAKATYELVVSGHDGEWKVTKEPTCTEPGAEVLVCTVCGEQLESREIPARGHSLTHTPAKDATCTEAGNKEFWTCETCGKYFSDADGKHEIDLEETVIAPLGHSFQHVDAVAPTVDSEGNIEYWFCPSCGAFFSDAEGKHEITERETVIPRLKVFKVTFDDCLPNTKNPVVEVVEGQSVGKANVPSDPVCEGYIFEGWFHYDLEHDAWGAAFDPEAPVAGDAFVAAKWTKASSDESTGANDESKPAPSKPGGTLAQAGDSSMIAIATAGTAGIASIIAGIAMALKRRRKRSE